MKKQKLNYIEAYAYAKTLHLLSSKTEIPQNNEEIKHFLLKTIDLSTKMLFACENKINQHKLNNPSFLVLKSQLESADYTSSTLINYSKLKKMLEKYNYYLSLIA